MGDLGAVDALVVPGEEWFNAFAWRRVWVVVDVFRRRELGPDALQLQQGSLVRAGDVEKAADLGEEQPFKFVQLDVGDYFSSVPIQPQSSTHILNDGFFQFLSSSGTFVFEPVEVDQRSHEVEVMVMRCQVHSDPFNAYIAALLMLLRALPIIIAEGYISPGYK